MRQAMGLHWNLLTLQKPLELAKVQERLAEQTFCQD
jgi:hypothetical protein